MTATVLALIVVQTVLVFVAGYLVGRGTRAGWPLALVNIFLIAFNVAGHSGWAP